MYTFYPMLSRMKYINRWGLMRNTRNENLCEHSLETAYIVHALVLIANRQFGENLNPEHAVVLAMYHDCSEIITGDLPTPIKYHNKNISTAYKEIEKHAVSTLISFLPEYLQADYNDIFSLSSDENIKYLPYIEAADKISAYIKCIEEKNSGNIEFIKAETSTLEKIQHFNIPAVEYFTKNILPLYSLTLDEHK